MQLPRFVTLTAGVDSPDAIRSADGEGAIPQEYPKLVGRAVVSDGLEPWRQHALPVAQP